jgi:hypothetical protein
MKKKTGRKLMLSSETLRTLNPGRLGAVRGGTVLVSETDPATAPPSDRDGGGSGRTTAYTCSCIG